MTELKFNGSPIALIEWTKVSDPASIKMIRTTDEDFCCNVQKDGTLLAEPDVCCDLVENDYWLAPGCSIY